VLYKFGFLKHRPNRLLQEDFDYLQKRYQLYVFISMESIKVYLREKTCWDLDWIPLAGSSENGTLKDPEGSVKIGNFSLLSDYWLLENDLLQGDSFS
jgi:hypothetical protein